MKTIASIIASVLLAAVLIQVNHIRPTAITAPIQGEFLMRSGVNEARISFWTTDGSTVRKLAISDFEHGIIIRDGVGNILKLRTIATLDQQTDSYQAFMLSNVQFVGNGKTVRVASLFVALFDGSDYDHHYESDLCTSPENAESACIAQWTAGLP